MRRRRRKENRKSAMAVKGAVEDGGPLNAEDTGAKSVVRTSGR